MEEEASSLSDHQELVLEKDIDAHRQKVQEGIKKRFLSSSNHGGPAPFSRCGPA